MKRLARWLFLRYWSDEIIEANAYVQRKTLHYQGMQGSRKDYLMREAGGATDVLMCLGLFAGRES